MHDAHQAPLCLKHDEAGRRSDLLFLLENERFKLMKTREQLNAEYTATLKQLKIFCEQMIRQTGRGAPEMDAFVTTVISIGTAWNQPSGTLEEVVCERMQGSLAFYRERLSKLDHWTRCPLSDRVMYTRELKAYEDLWQRMESGEWTLPNAIAPLVFCLVIDPHFRLFSFDAFFSALYHAHVCDLRAGFASGSFGKGALYAQTSPASYQRIQLLDPTGREALHAAMERKVSERLVLLIHPEQHDMEMVLRQQFPTVEFVFLPEPLPAVLL